MDEKGIERLIARDFSVGTERLRDELLARCLEVMRAGGDDAAPMPGSCEIDDEALDLLAAAGDVSTLATGQCFGDNKGPSI